jgi:hypothetical protein
VYWRCTPTVASPFQIPGVVEDQHAIGLTEFVSHVPAHVVSDLVGIPYRFAE